MNGFSRPRPVLTSAGISGAATSVAGLLAFLGYSNAATSLSGEAQTIGGVAVTVILLVLHLVPALVSQRAVTPLAAPQAADGTPLVRVDELSSVSDAPDVPDVSASEPVQPVPVGQDVAQALAAAAAIYPPAAEPVGTPAVADAPASDPASAAAAAGRPLPPATDTPA